MSQLFYIALRFLMKNTAPIVLNPITAVRIMIEVVVSLFELANNEF